MDIEAAQPQASALPTDWIPPVESVYGDFADSDFALTEIESQILAQIRRRAFESRRAGSRWADRLKLAI